MAKQSFSMAVDLWIFRLMGKPSINSAFLIATFDYRSAIAHKAATPKGRFPV